MVNDIIRFWKTLCLNYEHKRNRPIDDEVRKNETHLKNLKLKFSRLLTCFSAVAVICAGTKINTPENIVEMVHTPPMNRLYRLAEEGTAPEELISQLFDQYGWFLEITKIEKEKQIEWISDREKRDIGFDKARQFGLTMYKLLEYVSEGTDTLRYLVV